MNRPSPRLRRRAWLPAGLILLAAALPALPVRAQERVGTLEMLRGEASIVRRGVELRVRQRYPVRDGDRIVTGADAKALLVLQGPPAARAVLTRATTLQVHAWRAQRRSPLQLLFGAVRTRLRRWLAADLPFVVTPTATIGIKGTDFITYVKRPRASEFIGVEGLIRAASRSRPADAIEIGRRQWGEIVEGETPKPPIRVPDDLWEAALAEFSFPAVP